MNNAREELRQELCMVLIRNGVGNAGVEVDAILGRYTYRLTRAGLDWLGDKLGIHIYDEED